MKQNHQTIDAAVTALAMPESVSVVIADVAAVCGPKGKHDPNRTAVRHGSERGWVTLGGRRVPVERPRMRASDGSGALAAP